jgi:hypothetical protein
MKCVIAYPSIWIIQLFFLGLASIRNILKLDNPDSERERETSGTTFKSVMSLSSSTRKGKRGAAVRAHPGSDGPNSPQLPKASKLASENELPEGVAALDAVTPYLMCVREHDGKVRLPLARPPVSHPSRARAPHPSCTHNTTSITVYTIIHCVSNYQCQCRVSRMPQATRCSAASMLHSEQERVLKRAIGVMHGALVFLNIEKAHPYLFVIGGRACYMDQGEQTTTGHARMHATGRKGQRGGRRRGEKMEGEEAEEDTIRRRGGGEGGGGGGGIVKKKVK